MMKNINIPSDYDYASVRLDRQPEFLKKKAIEKRFIVESDFTHRGLRCVVVLHHAGHRCGYVGITKDHPLYGVEEACSISKPAPDSPNAAISDEACITNFTTVADTDGHTVCPEDIFSVHGGITYAEKGNETYPVNTSGIWWYGFDCQHCDDMQDVEAAKKAFGADWDGKDISHAGIIRSRGYCEDNCRDLADQLADFAEAWIKFQKKANRDAENKMLREALEQAVEMYGKPGGPWNVPSQPGSWINNAKKALRGIGK